MKKNRQKITACVLAVVVFVFYIAIPILPVIANSKVLSLEGTEKEVKESSLYAKSAVLMDAESGRVLYGKNKEEVLPMASTTKIMTLLIALEQGDLTQKVTVSRYAQSMPDVQLNMKEGEEYILEDLLYSLMLESHNDSAVAIAEAIAGSVEEFAVRMNQKAKEIGCKNTCFITPNGLDATAVLTDAQGKETEVFHSTTAEDLAKIMSYCITKSPCKEQFLKITQTPSYSFSNCAATRSFTCQNHNAFLTMMEGAISGKTGFTSKAGYCYVGALQQGDRTFVVALLACGWPNNRSYKWKDTRKLMEYGISEYQKIRYEEVLTKEAAQGYLPVINGQTKNIGETAYVKWEMEEFREQDAGVLLKEGERMELEKEICEELIAPVKEGTLIGTLRFKVGEESYLEKKLFTSEGAEKIDLAWCMKQVFWKFWL